MWSGIDRNAFMMDSHGHLMTRSLPKERPFLNNHFDLPSSWQITASTAFNKEKDWKPSTLCEIASLIMVTMRLQWMAQCASRRRFLGEKCVGWNQTRRMREGQDSLERVKTVWNWLVQRLTSPPANQVTALLHLLYLWLDKHWNQYLCSEPEALRCPSACDWAESVLEIDFHFRWYYYSLEWQ